MYSLSSSFKLMVAVCFATTLSLSGAALASSDSDNSTMDMDMGMGTVMDAPPVPAVNGFADGEPILFMHTEISDAGVAKILVDMMGGSPVPVVPSLAKAPAEMLAPVYVFTNGYSGMGPMGPLGGQPDIFKGVPGEADYSPLRNIILVTWSENATVSMLTSYEAVKSQLDQGALSIKEAGIVVNMPLLTWPGGSR